MELSRDEILRYSRHLLIPEIGLEGQQKLKAASALIIGAGGLGSPAALYLAAAGVGRIGLVDYDVVDESNLQRQVIHGTEAIGKLKVENAKRRLLDINPHIQVDAYNEVFTSANAMRIAKEYDVLLDGTDNFPTRYLSNDVCVFLGKPNVYGSIYRFDGQASVFYAKEGPCYRCLFPEPPPPGLVPSCAEGGVLGVLPAVIGSLQATEALKLLLGIGDPLIGRLLLYNALDMSFDFIKLKRNPNCRVCGPNADVTELVDYEAFCGLPSHDRADDSASADWDISARDLQTRLARDPNLLLLDVREPHELRISSIRDSVNIPLGQLTARLSELDTAREMVILCKSGTRSRRALELLVSAGFKKVKNLHGGINAWARDVDASLPIY
ncbi:MAG: molybdenum cofactor biosynthesis protein MoeB [Anaerolineaceae bacterium]|nr:molybdopterin-synthase adenylyltransferase MoeB [Anaerolineae bacterium]MBL1172595.1 molybdopterin-synthase adenylyltransferase MoeB [Chloroflexota bacterium]MDL1924839.1 molybdopterin-synthase adenylyltransferase MoeB [Anaerolineae bacterium AMX1]WKZ55299.1 MAG: molybdopterin-synthase adenylyltransferase MoeB [Anaerolineales bacterium]GJQ39119.1 MAG: molybdenum cofactor biosynthesis protein MoeB [Anaerolineaceae bacterium]